MGGETLFGPVDPIDQMVEELRKTPGWPADAERDRALIVELQREFPTLDLQDEFGKFRTWLLARGTGKEVRSRGRYQRVRNWCSNAARFSQQGGRAGARPRRTSTAPRGVEHFGGESSQSLSRW